MDDQYFKRTVCSLRSLIYCFWSSTTCTQLVLNILIIVRNFVSLLIAFNLSVSIHLSLCLCLSLSVCLSVYLSICLSVCLSVCLSLPLSLVSSDCHCNDWSFETYSAQCFRLFVRVTFLLPLSLTVLSVSDTHWLLLFSFPVLTIWTDQMFYCLIYGCMLIMYNGVMYACVHLALWTRYVLCGNSHVSNSTHSLMPICI